MAERRRKVYDGGRWPERDDVVRRAMEIIDPEPDRRDECREAIEQELAMLAHGVTELQLSPPAVTKQSKDAARRLGKALRRVVDVYAAVEGDLLSPAHADVSKIEGWIAGCEKSANEPVAFRARSEPEKMAVARVALDLLACYSRHKEVTGTRTGRLHRLVCILLGDRHGDHTFICRQALAECGIQKDPRGARNRARESTGRAQRDE
jgi:hypothetical protein